MLGKGAKLAGTAAQSLSAVDSLDNMKLYDNKNFNRILEQVQHYASQSNGPMSPNDVHGIDIMHYTTDWSELDPFIAQTSGVSSILDVGSGTGGASRYIAHKFGIDVTCVEYQTDLANLAKQINQIYTNTGADFTKHITVEQGDFLKFTPSQPYDMIMSQLAFLHIPDKEAIFDKIVECTEGTDGYFYIDDYVSNELEFDEEDKEILSKDIDISRLMSIEEYTQALSDRGFEILRMENPTSWWCEFVWNRLNNHIANRESYIAAPGSSEEHYNAQLHFYTAICKLFHVPNPEAYPNVPVGAENNNKPQVLEGMIIFGKKAAK